MQLMITTAIIFFEQKFAGIIVTALIIVIALLGINSQTSYFKQTDIRSLVSIFFILFFILITWEVFRKIMSAEKVSPEIMSAVI